MVKEATFVSAWDGESIRLESDCKVDMTTKEVFDIHTTDITGVDVLDEEYIIIDGEEFPVYQKDEAGDGEFWYD